MQASPEVEAVFRRALEARFTSDVDTVRSLHSRSEFIRSIGTDEKEWSQGFDEVVGIWETHQAERPPFEYEIKRTEAYEAGEVGWGAAEFVWRSPPKNEWEPARATAVLVLDIGTWRIIQLHLSLPVPNEQVLGIELTTTLSDLLSSIEQGSGRAVREHLAADTATVMFTDIVDSTALSREMGDESWSTLIERHFALLRRIVEDENGVVVKTLGDGAMFVFRSAGSSLAAAARIQQTLSMSQEKDLTVRIGVHTGDLVKQGGDYVGVTVNKAARVAAAATAEQVLVSSTTADMAAGSGFLFGQSTPVLLKGLEGRHLLVPLLWQDSLTA